MRWGLMFMWEVTVLANNTGFTRVQMFLMQPQCGTIGRYALLVVVVHGNMHVFTEGVQRCLGERKKVMGMGEHKIMMTLMG